MELLISKIKIGNRNRSDEGDVKALADSILSVGLLHPVVIDQNQNLIAGYRRIQAMKSLGKDKIEVTVATQLQTAIDALKAERDENVCREPMSPYDACVLAEKILKLEKPEAKKRQEEGGARGKEGGRGKKKTLLGTSVKGIRNYSSEIAAKAAGISVKTQKKVQKIDEAAKTNKRYKPFVEKLKKSRAKVDGIYKKFQKEQEQVVMEEAQAKITIEAKRNLNGVCDIRHCSMTDLFNSGIHPDIVITDPPYSKEFLPLYEDLALHCAKANIPTIAVMCGQSYLPEIMAAMCKHLTYRWTMAYLTPGGQAVQQWKVLVNTFWKPVLIFGDAPDWTGDVIKSSVNDNDKRFHGWGQSESGMKDLIEKLTKPEQLICDPFLGGGTTAVVSLQDGRRFIGCDSDEECVTKAIMRCEAIYAA